MKVEDLFIGYNDGKKEAQNRENFEEYYFNHDGIYEKILRSDKYLLLGRKGTGKTLLGEVIKKRASVQGDWLCEMISYKNFEFKRLFTLKTNDIKPNEYTAVWEWMILVKIANMCINDQTADSEATDKLRIFLQSNFFGLKLEMNKIVEETLKNKINGKILFDFLSFGKTSSTEKKITTGTYLDYIDDLKETVLKALNLSKVKYTLILDELDARFKNEELYKSNIISLIKTVDALNSDFQEFKIDVKVVILLRTDIFYILNDADLNKIEQDNSVKIHWGDSANKNSPLIKMVILKMKQSLINIEGSNIKNNNFSYFYNRMFPSEKRRGNSKKPYDSAAYILKRTFLRPRDVITFLRYAVESNPRSKNFSYEMLKKANRGYSDYLLKEIRNEMHGHLEEFEISESFSLLRQFKKRSFSYAEIESFYSSNRQDYPHIDLKKILKALFDFGVIGNVWNYRGKACFSWKYRENTTIDYNKNFSIHMGLMKELNIL